MHPQSMQEIALMGFCRDAVRSALP
ncbi:hypothetical protein EON81_15210 [bacterium]|nr:MAG: hypothetical protein EON81_15210 [bacterium]